MAKKFSLKRPVRADYIKKYGFQGDSIWRMELIRYNEAKMAWEHREENMKAFRKQVAEEEARKRTKNLYPDVYKAGGENAIKHLTKMHDKQREILNSKPAPKKSFEEFKRARQQLGLQSTKKDYDDYLIRIGAKKTPAKKTAKKVMPKKTAPKKTAPKKATAKRRK